MDNIKEYLATQSDLPQPLTNEQMTDIKSQFHPSNTANVNIVPYEIYDEDEHIVGEWREVVDGVKKRKPVYEKRFNELSFGTATNVWTNSGATIQDVSLLTSAKTIRTSNNTISYIFTFRSLNNNIQYFTFDEWSVPFDVLIVRYTKTTDEWQPV